MRFSKTQSSQNGERVIESVLKFRKNARYKVMDMPWNSCRGESVGAWFELRTAAASRYKLSSTYSSVQNVSTNNKEPLETLCKQSTLQRSAAPYSDCQLTWSYWWIRPTSKFHGAGKVVIFSHAKSSPKLFRPKCKRYYIL